MASVTMAEHGLAPGDPGQAQNREMMPGGIALSATLHVALLTVIVLGLPNLFHHPPPEETPIAVELVTIAPETRATHPNPYRPKPEAKPEPAVAAPAPKPEPKPDPTPPVPEPPPSASAPSLPAPPEPATSEVKAAPPPPPPPPKPVAAQAPPPPPRPPEPKPKPEPPQQASHQEMSKPDPKAFDRLLKNLEAKSKAEPASFDNLLKNLTHEQVAQAEDAPPAPHRMAATAPPSSQPKAPLGSQLTASELDALASQVKQQLVPCWNVPAGARDAKELSVRIRASVNPDGTVRSASIVEQGRMSDPLIRAAAESARRTFFNPQCTPLKLPGDKYEIWKDLDVTFDPRDLL